MSSEVKVDSLRSGPVSSTVAGGEGAGAVAVAELGPGWAVEVVKGVVEEGMKGAGMVRVHPLYRNTAIR